MKTLLNVLTSTYFFWTSVFGILSGFQAVPALASSLTPQAQLLRFEQAYVNRTLDENRIVALKNYQNSFFSPEEAQVFDVPSFWVEAGKFHVFEIPHHLKKLDISWTKTSSGKKYILFLVHPESLDFYRTLIQDAKPGPRFLGTATASSRTLLMWPADNPEKSFFGKLSLDKEVAGVVRTIPAGEIARSIGTTQILDQSADKLPDNFHFFPEALGVMPKGWERGGMIIRLFPSEMQERRKRVMPLFALYTKPADRKTSPIEDNLRLYAGTPEDFVVTQILKPFAALWTELVLEHRLAIEAHAQNVLIQINSKGQIEPHFYFRDFGGFNFDLDSRASLNLNVSNLPVIHNIQDDYHQHHSLSALQSSVGVYFEGGFLFGLAEELKRLGYKPLNYEKLITLSRQQIINSFKERGLNIRSENFWNDLQKALTRSQKIISSKTCRSALI